MNDPWLDALRREGITFWGNRNVKIDPNLAIQVRDLGKVGTSRVDGEAKIGELILDSYSTGVALRRARSKRRSVGERRRALEDLARTIFHELGHAGGLNHTPDAATGIMSGTRNYDIPYDAQVLIRKLIPRGRS